MKSSGNRARADAIYFHTAADALADAQGHGERLARAERVITTIVFSAMCLEAFANEQCHVSSNECGEFERLSAKAKWQWLARNLGDGKSFSEHSPPFSDFGDLVELRNQRLVHFKPWKEERWLGRDYENAAFLDVATDVELAGRALSVVPAMIRELHRITNGRTEIPQYLDGVRFVANVWSSVTTSVHIAVTDDEAQREASDGST